jgi:hypothetical protein
VFVDRHFDIRDGHYPLGPTAHRPGEIRGTRWRPVDNGLTPLRGSEDQWLNGVSYIDYLAGRLTPVPQGEWIEGPECDCMPGATIRRAAAADLIPFSVPTKIVFDTVVNDDLGFFNPATPTRLTVPAGWGGTYLVGAVLQWSGTGSPGEGNFLNVIRNNTSGICPTTFPWQSSGSPLPAATASARVVLADGDYVELSVRTMHAGGNFYSLSPEHPSLWLQRLGPCPPPPP